MNIDLPLILLMLLVISGLIALCDWLFWRKQRQAGDVVPWVIDYSRSFFPVFVLVLILRSFVFQFYEVPTPSLAPTVQPIEFLLVSQFAYGLRLPVWGQKILSVHEPKRGDITLFQWPVSHKHLFVKRTIGLPGDRISYINKTFYINGVEAKKHFIRNATGYDGKRSFPVQIWEENLLGFKHYIYLRSDQPANDFKNLLVPKGQYLEIGDNRDDSDDSRYWGFVHEKLLVGKAERIILSWNPRKHRVRWHRLGHSLTQSLP